MNEKILQEHFYFHFNDKKTLVIGAAEALDWSKLFHLFHNGKLQEC